MSFLQGLEKEMNTSVTENGAEGYKTTGKSILDFNFKIASYRGKSEAEILNDFRDVWFENKELALKFLFYIRDVREGIGERRLFRTILPEIAYAVDERVFDWIAKYGRYDDLFVLFGTELGSKMIDYVRNQLLEDTRNVQENKPISLLAKWMPSINTSSNDTKALAKKFIKALGINEKTYRKMLSGLRKYLDVIERKCCENKWTEIDYNKVPSLANLKYKDAFLRHDPEGRQKYFDNLTSGEAKINSSVAFPHDIVSKYSMQYNLHKIDTALEEMWKALPDYVNGTTNTLVVRDGSGSMCCTIENTKTQALDVATALAIYFSERANGDFKDKFITFSSSPRLVDLSKCTTLSDKLVKCYKEDDCSNTDIYATFNLVLKVAIDNNLKQEEIPNLLIISDMEFDCATTTRSALRSKLFSTIADKYKQAGYELPKLIFWNVNSRTNTIPIVENNLGVTLVSGFSPAVIKMVLTEELDPYKALVKQLMSERYADIKLK